MHIWQLKLSDDLLPTLRKKLGSSTHPEVLAEVTKGLRAKGIQIFITDKDTYQPGDIIPIDLYQANNPDAQQFIEKAYNSPASCARRTHRQLIAALASIQAASLTGFIQSTTFKDELTAIQSRLATIASSIATHQLTNQP
jgi:hypothetical protein